MLKLINIRRSFNNHVALNNVSISFANKGLYAIVGPSGCGKTTLLNIISGIDNDYQGSYLRSCHDMKQLTEEKRRLFRLNEVGYVFQDFRLFESDSALDNVLLIVDACSKSSKSMKRRYAMSLLEKVGMAEKHSQNTGVLSGGEKQRTSIARALAANPSIIICDEPTGALDASNAVMVMSILASIAKTRLVIVVSHDEQLVCRFANHLLKMCDGQIVETRNLYNGLDGKRFVICGGPEKTSGSHLATSSMLRRAISILKARKGRLIINNAMMSLGLLGIGFSIIMSFSIESKIVDGFSTIIDNRMIVMSRSHDTNDGGATYSASFDKVFQIKEKYSECLSDVGVSYNVNFETFFPTRDELFVSSTTHKIVLPRFSSRQIGDYLWLDELPNLIVYPRQINPLYDDELIVGVPYNDMAGLCFSLHIERSYASLGEYIRKNTTLITFGVANSDWQYDDEQVFQLQGVVETESPTIYHTNHLWSQYVFEDKMRLPSFDGGRREYPWQMHKIFFLMGKKPCETFLHQAFYDQNLNDFVFELAGSAFHPTLCPISGPCPTNRLLVFHYDKEAIDVSQITAIQRQEPAIQSYIPVSDGGYYYQPNSFISGFAKNIYFSLSRAKIEEVVDADTISEDEYAGYAIEPPSGVLQGSIHTALSGGVTFSADLSKIVLGSQPTNLDEIVVSQKMADYLSSAKDIIGKTLQIAVNYKNIPYEGNRLEKCYALIELRVTGVAEGSNMSIHHIPFWCVGFLQIKAGVSAFELITRHLLIFVSESKAKDDTIARLSKRYSNLRFFDPMKDIQTSLDETLSFMRIVLLAFSSLAVITSVFLFFMVMIVTIEENRNDIVLMHYLGISRRDTRNCFIVMGLAISFPAFVISSVEIIIVDFLINHVIAGYVGTNIPYVFDPAALMAIILSALAIAYLSSYLAFAKHEHRNKEKRLHYVKKIQK